MTIRRLEKSQYQGYFDRVSRELGACRARIEVSGVDIGNQVEAEEAVLHGLVYDPADDQFEVVTEAVDHLVSHPQDIYVDDDIEGLHSVQLLDMDGHKQVIELSAPLKLPAD